MLYNLVNEWLFWYFDYKLSIFSCFILLSSPPCLISVFLFCFVIVAAVLWCWVGVFVLNGTVAMLFQKKNVAIKCVIVCVVEFGILVIIISLKHIQYLIGLAVRTYKICVYEVSSQGLEVRTFSWFFYTRISHKFIILS